MTARADRPPVEASGPVSTGLVQLVLIGTSAVMLYPIVIMIFSAFKTTAEIFDDPFGLPPLSELTTWSNFSRILAEANFATYLANSLAVTGGSVALILILGTMAAYAIGRYRFALATPIFLLFLAGLMLPLKLAIIPLFIQMNALGLIDSRLSLVIVYVAMGLPSTVFIMTGFLRTLPGEIEDAARIDGASEPRIMISVMLPLCRPPLVIAAIHNAVPIWNDFFFPLIFIQSDARKTLPQGLTAFMGEYTTDWGMLFAGLTLAALPITIVYIVLSRQFIAGMTQGAVK